MSSSFSLDSFILTITVLPTIVTLFVALCLSGLQNRFRVEKTLGLGEKYILDWDKKVPKMIRGRRRQGQLQDVDFDFNPEKSSTREHSHYYTLREFNWISDFA